VSQAGQRGRDRGTGGHEPGRKQALFKKNTCPPKLCQRQFKNERANLAAAAGPSGTSACGIGAFEIWSQICSDALLKEENGQIMGKSEDRLIVISGQLKKEQHFDEIRLLLSSNPAFNSFP